MKSLLLHPLLGGEGINFLFLAIVLMQIDAANSFIIWY